MFLQIIAPRSPLPSLICLYRCVRFQCDGGCWQLRQGFLPFAGWWWICPCYTWVILGPTPQWIRVRRQKNFQLYLGENINLNLFLTCHININKKYFYYYYGLFDDFFLAVNGGVAFQDTMLKDNDIICNKVHRLEMSRNSKIYMCDAYRHTCTWVIELDHLSLSQVQNMPVSMVRYYIGIIENYVGKLMHLI